MNAEDLDALFTRMLLVYGAPRLEAMYRNQPMAQVRAHWLQELRHLTTSDVAYGMTMLPADFVPNVLQFKAIALRNPPAPLRALDAPQVSAVDRARVVEALRGLAEELQARKDPKAWAHALKAREAAGERLTVFQKSCWREALGEN